MCEVAILSRLGGQAGTRAVGCTSLALGGGDGDLGGVDSIGLSGHQGGEQ